MEKTTSSASWGGEVTQSPAVIPGRAHTRPSSVIARSRKPPLPWKLTNSELTVPEVPKTEPLYVMVNCGDIPVELATLMDIFHLFDGNKFVVGFCLPHSVFCGKIGEPSKARVLKKEEMDVTYEEEYRSRYKLSFVPLKTVSEDEEAFNLMMDSPYLPYEKKELVKNRFFVCPDFKKEMDPRGGCRAGRNSDTSSTTYVLGRFKLETNPHLIPCRFPDGLECYMRLDLAEHCQQPFQPEDEREFGFYHFGDVQRELSKSVGHHHHHSNKQVGYQMQQQRQDVQPRTQVYSKSRQQSPHRHHPPPPVVRATPTQPKPVPVMHSTTSDDVHTKPSPIAPTNRSGSGGAHMKTSSTMRPNDVQLKASPGMRPSSSAPQPLPVMRPTSGGAKPKSSPKVIIVPSAMNEVEKERRKREEERKAKHREGRHSKGA